MKEGEGCFRRVGGEGGEGVSSGDGAEKREKDYSPIRRTQGVGGDEQ